MHTREIDQIELTTRREAYLTYVLLNRDARVVGDLLTKAGQLIEERRLPRVRRTDECDERKVRRASYEGVGAGIAPRGGVQLIQCRKAASAGVVQA
jgi:hypothetical protein